MIIVNENISVTPSGVYLPSLNVIYNIPCAKILINVKQKKIRVCDNKIAKKVHLSIMRRYTKKVRA